MKPEYVLERDGRRFVKYGGLLDEAHEQGLKSITTSLIQVPSPENQNVAIVIASVVTERGTFSGIGDASPRNVSQFLNEATIRMAETRAKARALRDAVNVDMTALEELGDHDEHDAAPSEIPFASPKQVEFIVSLAKQAGINEERFIARYGHAPEELDRDMASMVIEELKSGKSEPKPVSEPTPIRPAAAPAQAPVNAESATVAQVRAIYSISRKAGYSEPETDARCLAQFNCAPHYLTKQQASKWIGQLQEEVK